MEKRIIQHHAETDFVALYKTIGTRYVGIDYKDLDLFMQLNGKKHSFIGLDKGIKNALRKVIESEGCRDLLKRTSAVIITVLHSPMSENPLRINEIECLNEFIEELPPECNAIWGIHSNESLGNDIKVIMLLSIDM